MIVLVYVGGLYANTCTHLFIVCMLLFYNKNSDFTVSQNGQNHLQALPQGNRAVIDMKCHLNERAGSYAALWEKRAMKKNRDGEREREQKILKSTRLFLSTFYTTRTL